MRCLARSKDDKANDTDSFVPQKKETTLLQLIGEIAHNDTINASKHVDGDGHELSGIIGVAQILDDGRKEQSNRVKRRKKTTGEDHVNPDLPIFQSLCNVSQVEGVREIIVVGCQTSLNLDFFGGGKEFGAKYTLVLSHFFSEKTYVAGESWTSQNPKLPTRKVRIPSRMKIQAHPPLPATPAISEIPRASSPPNAPAAVAAEKNIAIRKPVSWRGYQTVIKKQIPGKRPPSAMPRKTRAAIRPW
jgi:hypothetical protein